MKQINETIYTELYGLLGYPLGHSFSARYFREKFAKENIDAEYRNFEVPSVGMLPEIIRSHPNLRGLNVTVPYKEKVIPYLDAIDSRAEEIGAVNVICVSHNAGAVRLVGHNADVIGFMDSLRPLLGPQHTKALVLGTGGASKAVVYGLHTAGIETLYVSRRAGEGRITYADIERQTMEEYRLIVNCTPLGMSPKVDACPDIPYGMLTEQHLLYDLVYNPELTLFLRKGREHGAKVKNGMEMLLRQAEASWAFWTGKDE